jgi:hypothetical protein
LKTLVCSNYSIQNIMQFSHGEKLPDAPAFNTDFFFEGYMCSFNLDE